MTLANAYFTRLYAVIVHKLQSEKNLIENLTIQSRFKKKKTLTQLFSFY